MATLSPTTQAVHPGRASSASNVKLLLAWLAVMIPAFALFVANTWQGIGIYIDSTRYMGLSPVGFDAPVYHWLLVGGHALGFSFDQVALFWAAIFVVANVSLIFALIARATRGWVFALAGTALIAFSPQFVTLHTGALSEPPFVMCVLLTLWAILNFFESERRLWLVIAALLIAIGSLTRFTMPPLGAAIACVILLNPKRSFPAKIGDIAILGGLSGALFFLWVGISQMEVGRSIGRDLWFYGTMGAAEWRSSFGAMAAWVLPKPAPFSLRILVVLAVVCFGAWRWLVTARQLRRDPEAGVDDPAISLPLILGAFFVLYLAFVGLSVSIEANLSLTGRYAFPAYVLLVMLVSIEASKLSRRNFVERLALYGLAALSVVVLGGHIVRTSARTLDVAREGYGFQSLQWRHSPTMAMVKTLPPDTRIYSNAPDVIAYMTGRTAQFSPHEKQLRTNLPEPGNPLERQIQRVQQEARSGEIAIVFFDGIDWRFYLADEQVLAARLPATLVGSFADGRVYRVAAAGNGGAPHD
ncbi:MAG: glycosyltransferase family 39 protein [Porphyrobacter sp.]|nr:glycosyltransferase family 39 protein [Porphyrobacter sp.]